MVLTAMVPPYFNSWLLKEICTSPSVALMVKGETPSAMMGSSTFQRIFRYCLRIFKMLLSLNRNCRAQTADTPCPITVAMLSLIHIYKRA